MNIKNFYRGALLLFIPVIYYLIISGFNGTTENLQTKQTLAVITAEPKDFIMFPLNISSQAENYGWNTEKLIDPYNYIGELNFNAAHIYDEWDGSDRLGRFSSSGFIGGQVDEMNDIINTAENNGLSSVFERANISRLCYGQRLIYEAEGDNFGFSYNSTTGLIETDDGRTVVHGCTGTVSCAETDATPRLLCYDIEENMMHSDLQWFRPGMGDYSTWHLKPVMKIRTQDFDPDDETPVVTIEVRDFDGDILESIVIKVRNFKDENEEYDGEYIDVYNFIDEFPLVDLDIPGDESSNGLNRNWDKNKIYNQTVGVDFRVYWHGNVDVWFDKMVVDDEVANKLFDPNALNNYNGKMTEELNEFVLNPEDKALNTFFVDECSFSNIPCIKYVQSFIRSYNTANSTNARLSYATSNNLNRYSWKNDGLDRAFNLFLDSTRPQYFQIDAHCIYFDPWQPGYIPSFALDPGDIDSKVPDSWKTDSYNTYNNYLQKLLGTKELGETPLPHEGSLVFQVWQARSQIDGNSPETRLVVQPQIQHWSNAVSQGGEFTSGVREPTNEEISVQAWIALAYGADAISWFWIPTDNSATTEGLPLGGRRPGDDAAPWFYVYGLMDDFDSPRTENLYGQDKYTEVGQINAKILNIKSTLDLITWKSAFSVHSEGAGHEFIYDILSMDPHRQGANGECPVYGPIWYDCPDKRYWELGFFEDVDRTKYFMAVNRRCVPEGGEFDGDDRVLKIKFDAADFPLSNWIITDLNTGASKTFAKNNSGDFDYIDLGSTNGGLGWFEPGEGKLFKIEAVPVKGGTLVADEDISDIEFTCEDTVYNGGYNITIDSGSTVSFTDSATIIMSGGTFTSGVHGEDNLTTYKGLGSANWNGLRFNGTTVKIYNSKFQDIASPSVNYAVSMLNCPLADIRTNEFVLDTDTAGAVQSVYLDGDGLPSMLGLYINYNSITMNNSRGTGISVQGFAGLTIPVYAMNNTMTSGGYATGIMLSTITGGAVKKNIITDFTTGINAMFSTLDIYGNVISNTVGVSNGIMASGSSAVNLLPSGGLWLGGFNSFTNNSGASKNIEVDGSVFYLDGGNNQFYVSTGVSAHHLYGTFWDGAAPTDQRNNCFTFSSGVVTSSSTPADYVTDGSTQIVLSYTDYSCSGTPPTGTYIANIGNGLYDTIPSSSEGPGGGGKKSALSLYTLTAPQLYDSMRVNLRKRNYSNVKTFSAELIENYPGTYEAISSLQALYISTLATDTTTSGITALKTFYETLILNNGTNIALIKISYYLVQKCKVTLGEYSSALSGFQQIINNNPYSYDGLIARWDYMATSLLAPGGGGLSSIDNDQLSIGSSEAEEFDEFYGDDKNPFTKEQKQDIRKSVTTVFEITKNADEVKIKTLEVNSEKGDETAKKELQQMKMMKEIVKSEKPKTMSEHIRIVSSDVQRVFGNKQPITGGKGTGSIPREFRISQNYPNPFNPTTKINYDLPKDSKVSIVIYDILGREVKRLVNNEIKTAGTYIVDFNAANYASGVYFYRIEAEEPNGNKFIDSKKMVLLK